MNVNIPTESEIREIVREEMASFFKEHKEAVALVSAAANIKTPSDDCDIRNLDFTTRTSNALAEAGVKTIGDLRKICVREMHEWRNCGGRAIREIVLTAQILGIFVPYNRED